MHQTKFFPIFFRYGYKVWTLSTSDGYCLWMEPYCGAATRIPDLGLGQGPNVVVGLAMKADLRPGTNIYMDNLFTSSALLSRLSQAGIGGTGTVRKNRRVKVPLPQDEESEDMKCNKDMERGEVAFAYKDDQVMVCWRDSKPVYVLSNIHGKLPDGQEEQAHCERFIKDKGGRTFIHRPSVLKAYNENMGGVDLLDAQVARYRIGVKKKKWYWCFIPFSISVLINNAWRLRNRVLRANGIEVDTKHTHSFLNFIRDVAEALCKCYNRSYYTPTRSNLPTDRANRKKKKSKLHYKGRLPLDDVRYDGKGHLIVPIPKKATRLCKLCRINGKKIKSAYWCKKCAAPLHIKCFTPFHSLPVNDGGDEGFAPLGEEEEEEEEEQQADQDMAGRGEEQQADQDMAGRGEQQQQADQDMAGRGEQQQADQDMAGRGEQQQADQDMAGREEQQQADQDMAGREEQIDVEMVDLDLALQMAMDDYVPPRVDAKYAGLGIGQKL